MLAYFLIFLGAALRVIPHPANFAPIAAIGLFGGVYLSRTQAIVLPLVAMLVSDFFIGFDSLQTRLVVYGSILLSSLIGIWVRKHKNLFTVAGGSVLGSTLFFLITNCVIFYSTAMYPHTLGGQLVSYTNALPFFGNTLAGDLVYTALFFGIYEAVAVWQAKYAYAHNHQS